MSEHTSESFTRGLFVGEIHEDMVFPFPRFDPDERSRVEGLLGDLRSWADENYDAQAVERERQLPEGAWRELGELGMLGLAVDESFGGQGLTQTGYCKLFEQIGAIDTTLAVILGVHQSIGYKGIVDEGACRRACGFRRSARPR